MRALITCVSGVTTNILANRLNKYAKSIKFDVNFIPCRADINEDLLKHVDIVVIAPQARLYYDKYLSLNLDIPLVLIDEQLFVLGKDKDIFEYIISFVKNTKNEDNLYKHLDLKMLINVIVSSLLAIIPLVILGFIFYLLSFKFNYFVYIYEATLKIIGLFIGVSLGYNFARYTANNKSICMLMNTTIIFLLAPAYSNLQYIGTSSLSYGYIDMNYFSIRNILFILFISVLAILIYDPLIDFFKIDRDSQFKLMSFKYMLFTATYMLIFLLLRYLVYLFL